MAPTSFGEAMPDHRKLGRRHDKVDSVDTCVCDVKGTRGLDV